MLSAQTKRTHCNKVVYRSFEEFENVSVEHFRKSILIFSSKWEREEMGELGF